MVSPRKCVYWHSLLNWVIIDHLITPHDVKHNYKRTVRRWRSVEGQQAETCVCFPAELSLSAVAWTSTCCQNQRSSCCRCVFSMRRISANKVSVILCHTRGPRLLKRSDIQIRCVCENEWATVSWTHTSVSVYVLPSGSIKHLSVIYLFYYNTNTNQCIHMNDLKWHVRILNN